MHWVCKITNKTNRVFTHEVLAAVLLHQNNKTAATLVKPILWELNSFLIKKTHFVLLEYICVAAGNMSENAIWIRQSIAAAYPS